MAGTKPSEPRLVRPTERPIMTRVMNAVGRPRRLAPREVLVHQGDPRDRYYLVQEGLLRVAGTRADGSPFVISLLGPGHSVGNACYLYDDPEPHDAGATAVIESLVLEAGAAEIMAAVESPSDFLLEEAQFLGRMCLRMIRRVQAVSVVSIRQRVAEHLLLDATPGASGGLVVIATHQELAEAVLAHRCTVTRVLRELSEAGLIQQSLGRIVIRDPNALLAFCQPY